MNYNMETGETFPIFETDKYFTQYVRDEYNIFAIDFVKIINKDDKDFIVTNDTFGNRNESYVDYKNMVHWLINNYPNGINNSDK